MTACRVTLYRWDAVGRWARRRCGQPVARWGLCERHAADHARLCDGCGRCGR